MHPFFRRSPGHLLAQLLTRVPRSSLISPSLISPSLPSCWDTPAATAGQTPAVTAALLQTLLRDHPKPAVPSPGLRTWAAQLCEDHASLQGPSW